MLNSRHSMPTVLDRHIETEEQDAFGHRHYAQALRCLIEDVRHKPPFSIGLLGGWGTGKSSIKELYTHSLVDDTSTAGERIPRSQRFKSITFNAWRFGGKEQDIKRALLRHVFLELGGDEGKLHDDLYRNVTHTESRTKPVWELTKQHFANWIAPAPALLTALLLYFLIIYFGLTWLPLHNELAQTLVLAAVTGMFAYLIKVMKPSAVSPFNTVTRVHLPTVSAEQYEELLLQQLRKFKPEKSNAVPYERLVIFVDDLDRLSAEEMVLGLDAVRTFMEIPSEKLPENLGLVFVISCDEGKVADALSRRRGNPEQPGSVFNPTDARRYLDRIFQFRLEIPPPPRNDMRQFALSKLESFPDLVKEIKENGASIEQVTDRMIHTNVTDPRKALQIINAFTQTWWLAKARELDAIGSNRPGGLHEGAVTKHPIALGALSAARVSFPGFYRDLQDNPQLLYRLTNLMVRQTLIKDEPLESHHILKRYVEQDEAGKTIVMEGCRELRQFLSSLVGIRWPDSLQSLLLLSEDFATRQYGGHASRIYEHLVSGDTQGFIEALSPRASEFLNDQETELLHNMLSDLHRTEEALKFNAMRVVADVIDRLPPRTRHLILGILCNDIVTSAELRSLLGTEKIARITDVANSHDRQNIASALIEEMFTSEQKVSMRLASGQAPSLDETITMARDAAEIALSVFQSVGLPSNSKDKLMAWLCERNVSAEAGSYTFDFTQLQQWMNRYDSSLLPEIGAPYVEQLTAALHELEKNVDDDLETQLSLDLPATADRINKVWERLAGEGQESRDLLWEQVTQLSTINAPELIDCVINALERYAVHARDEYLLDCLARFSHRVSSFELAPLAYKRAFRLLVGLGASKLQQFNDTHYEAYASFAVSLSAIEGYEQDASEIFSTFLSHDTQALTQVAESWIDAPLSNVSSLCRNQLFSAYGRLPEGDQESLVAYLTELTVTSQLDVDDEALYTDAASHIPLDYWKDEFLRPHLDSLLPTLHTKVSDWHSYLPHIFPGLSQVFMQATPEVLGPALQRLFTSAKNHEDAFDPLHSYFIGRWPTKKQLPRGYSPEGLFTEAQQTANSSPGFVGRHTLSSLNSMLADEVIPDTLSSNLVEIACAVWKHKPVEAVAFLCSGEVEMSAAQIKGLAANIDYNDIEEVDLLERVWSAMTPNLSISEDEEITKAVLALDKRGTTADPDLILTLWCRALGAEAHNNLEKLLRAPDTNDEQRSRLFHQILRDEGGCSEDESKKIPTLALMLLKIVDSPHTWAAVDKHRVDINKHFLTQDDRLIYARLLLNELANGASDTAKGHMVEWAKTLGTEAVLKDTQPDGLSEGDITIIQNVFGKSRPMTGLLKRWKNRK